MYGCRKSVRNCGAGRVEGVQLSTFLLLMEAFVLVAKYALEANVCLKVKRITILNLMLPYMEVGVSGHDSLIVQGVVVVVCNTSYESATVQSKSWT